MSYVIAALGQKRTFRGEFVMSALPPKADMCSALELSARTNSGTRKLGLRCCGDWKARSHGPAVGGADRSPHRVAGDLLRSSTPLGARRKWCQRRSLEPADYD